MIEWLGIEHLFELSTTEAVLGFFTPLAIFAAFAVAQLILPGRWVPGYVINQETGKPRNYRLNGLLVFAIALLVWGFAFEPMGIPRDWFYRTSVFAVLGGTVFTLLFAIPGGIQPTGGRDKEPAVGPVVRAGAGNFVLQRTVRREDVLLRRRWDDVVAQRFVGGRLALRTVRRQLQPGRLHVCGVLHVLRDGLLHFRAGPALHLRLDPREDGLHDVLGRPGDLRVGVHPAAVGHGRAPAPRILDDVDVCVAHRNGCVVPDRMDHLAGGEPAEVLVQAVPGPEVPGDHPARVHTGGRPQDPVQRTVGCGQALQLHGEGFLSFSIAMVFGHFGNPWAWTYFVFVVTFFTFRQRGDDVQCAEKYGEEKWAEYQARVPYRIFPGVIDGVRSTRAAHWNHPVMSRKMSHIESRVIHGSGEIMNQLTVRGFDDELSASLRRLAAREGISLNKAALKLLRKGAGLSDGKDHGNTVGSSLDHLIGKWTEEEALQFNRELEVFETIDEEMWK